MVKKVFDPVGVCIYCGATSDLRLEHIVPAGLGGNLELPDSSCSECEKITSAFELKVLRNELLPIRSAQNLRKKKKKEELRKLFPVTVTTGGKESILETKAENLPSMMTLLFFDFPGHLKAATPRADELRVTGYYNEHSKNFLDSVVLGTDIDSGKTTTLDISRTVDYDVHSFSRILAKIGLGYAIGELGIETFQEIFVREVILGNSENVGRWVGGDFYASSLNINDLHGLRIRRVKNEVHVKIQLFAQSSGSPVYTVIVGRI